MEKKSRDEERAEKRRIWEAHLKSWKESGLSQAKFCREKELEARRFLYWKKRIMPQKASFVEIAISRPSYSAVSPISIVVGGHYRIEIQEGFNPASLEQVLKVVGGL